MSIVRKDLISNLLTRASVRYSACRMDRKLNLFAPNSAGHWQVCRGGMTLNAFVWEGDYVGGGITRINAAAGRVADNRSPVTSICR